VDSLQLKTKKLIAADTIAMAVYSVVNGLIGLFLTHVYEVRWVGLTFNQWLGIRLIFNPLKFGGAYFCGQLTNRFRKRLVGNSKSWFWKAIADSLAISAFQLPLYAVSALVMGVSLVKIAIFIGIYLVDNAIFGWTYGWILDWMRLRFAVDGTKSTKSKVESLKLKVATMDEEEVA